MGKNRKREKECDEGTLSEKSVSKQSVNIGQDRTTTTSSTLTEHGSTQLLNNSQKDGHLTDFETVTFIPDNSKRNGQITDLDTINLSCNSKGNSMLTMPDTVNSTNGQITGLETVHKCISDIEANNNPVLQRHCNPLEIMDISVLIEAMILHLDSIIRLLNILNQYVYQMWDTKRRDFPYQHLCLQEDL